MFLYNLQLQTTLKTKSLILSSCLGFALFIAMIMNISATAYAQSSNNLPHKNFLPLRTIGKTLMPGGFVSPRFRRGAHRVNFFVDGNELQGLLDPQLSTACSLGQFNQKKKRRNFVNIKMPNERIQRFGFATSNGYNLKDRKDLKEEGMIYLFDLDGSSECRVYGLAAP